ncbi:coagulation factor X-like [Polyodon spathula]|uniref:coagulation factor X-like n=1 Tax=Polyodon spathula TaxID=7913 RepID=UPI001B7F376B|nr:coagulation factor X-like [Polyodon spathula]
MGPISHRRSVSWWRGLLTSQTMMAQLLWICLSFFSLTFIEANVFLSQESASQVFRRHKRANSFFEELKKGNLERECHEEQCSYEEAREVFETEEPTMEFWNKYVDGDQCEKKPCQNNAGCKDGIGEYTCLCNEGFQGKNCEIEIPKLCETNNGDCDHFCKVDRDVTCSCAEGYKLGQDGKSCMPSDLFPCGLLQTSKTRSISEVAEPLPAPERNLTEAENRTDLHPTDTPENENSRIVGGGDCPIGHCPWQALLVNQDGVGFCGGTILSNRIVLTAAHCMNQTKYFTVILGEFDTLKDEGREKTYQVEKVLIHNSYVQKTYNNDIALVKLKDPIQFSKYIIPACLPNREFAERVLMNQPFAQISGFGRVHERGRQSTKLQKLNVPYVDRHVCMESSLFKISVNMFCAGYDQMEMDACQGDSGGPHVTAHKDTWFVTGVVSWGEGCARKGKYGIYTQVSRYLRWIQQAMKRL